MGSDDNPWWVPVAVTLAVLVLTPLAEGLGERLAVAVFGEDDDNHGDDDERDALAVLRTIVELENE